MALKCISAGQLRRRTRRNGLCVRVWRWIEAVKDNRGTRSIGRARRDWHWRGRYRRKRKRATRPSWLASGGRYATHVAARLQAIAAPNSVVIAEATSRLISTSIQSARFGTAKSRGYRGAHACVSGSAHTAKPKSLPGRPWGRIDALGWAAHGAGLAATALARCKGWRRACSV